ncbi:hypothetical protein H5410_063926 [Solanum commersonii]|uniref:PUB2-4-like N-terminal domain-containing protein n=1 Tax=Solanum commersonii TaxID=4109 RepID=A0A9J5WGS7_SOLCO|nr:hypothetical protein H5410_063926 [Solanum commersonii]
MLMDTYVAALWRGGHGFEPWKQPLAKCRNRFCARVSNQLTEDYYFLEVTSNISQFFHLSSSESIADILVQRYYCKAEDLLKILKPILEAIVDVEAAFSEMLQKALPD